MFLPWDITVSSGADFDKNIEKAAWLAQQMDAYSNEEISDSDLDESLAEIGIDPYQFDQIVWQNLKYAFAITL